jgi:uncharacterized protein (TIGR03437 family)
LLPVEVVIGGSPARVLYAGTAPGSINGLLQINAVVPQDVQTGAAVPVSIRIGSFASPAGTTLPIAPRPPAR